MSGVEFNKTQLLEWSGFDVWLAGNFLGSIRFDLETGNWAFYPNGDSSPLFIDKDFFALQCEIQAGALDGRLETSSLAEIA